MAGGAAVAGIQWDTTHFMTIDEAGYEVGGKTNDNDNTSSRGHSRYLRGNVYYRVGSWGFGPGCSWSKTYTPAYTKTSVHPRVGFVKDWDGIGGRIQVAYVHPGTDWMNSVQGFEGQAWWGRGHLFLRMMVGGYWAHNTVTNRNDPVLTKDEKSVHVLSNQEQVLLGWRF